MDAAKAAERILVGTGVEEAEVLLAFCTELGKAGVDTVLAVPPVAAWWGEREHDRRRKP